MVEITFPYPDFTPINVPQENLMGEFSPSLENGQKAESELIEEAFLNPVGAEPLSKVLKGCRHVLVVVDDYTRSTPVDRIFPRLKEELRSARIKDEDIKIMVALGTHRPMTQEEMLKKFGSTLCEGYKILNHQWWDKEQLIYLGDTKKGTSIVVNKIVKEVDFIIGIGQIVPHRVTGFSGGGNIIQPGICGEITTGKTHWLAAQFTGREILGKIENPVKDEVEEVAQRAGLKWIINTVQNGHGDVIHVVAGDPVLAYREGAKKSYDIYKAEIPSEADIVIADSYPFDSELWLAAKGIYASELAVKKEGVVILISPCPEGISPSHPEVLEMGYNTFENVHRLLQKGSIQKLTVAAHLVHVGRVIKDRARGILVSKGITADEAERLGFIHGKTPQEAFDKALSMCGSKAKIAVLRRGGEILPVIKEAP